MLIKASTLKKRKILTSKGKQLETVDDILYDPSKKAVIGFVAHKSGIFTEAKILLKNSIQQIGKNAILVVSDDAVKKTSELDSHFQELVKNSKMNLTDNKLVGEDATEYGTSTDVFFESQSGIVQGFEYIKAESPHQKKTMKLEDIISVGSDAIVVRPVMVNNAGEVKPPKNKAMNRAKQVAEAAVQNVHIQQSRSQVKQKKPLQQATPVRQATDMQQFTVQQSTTNDISTEKIQQIKDTIGKYATKNILLPTDELLIKQNEILTHESLRIAYTYGVLDQVLQNASRTPVM